MRFKNSIIHCHFQNPLGNSYCASYHTHPHTKKKKKSSIPVKIVFMPKLGLFPSLHTDLSLCRDCWLSCCASWCLISCHWWYGCHRLSSHRSLTQSTAQGFTNSHSRSVFVGFQCTRYTHTGWWYRICSVNLPEFYSWFFLF